MEESSSPFDLLWASIGESMNPRARAYIENTLQPWRLPENVKSALGSQAANPVSSQDQSVMAKYFTENFRLTPTGQDYERLFEAELISIYYDVLACLPAEVVAFFRKNVAFGACYTEKPGTHATRLEDSLVILWDFQFDDLISQPAALNAAFRQSLLDAETTVSLLPKCVARYAFNVGAYASPLSGLLIDRTWLNQLAWGVAAYAIAHEIAHIALGHLFNATMSPLQMTDRRGQLIDFGVYNKTQQQEIQADIAAVRILVDGIRAGKLEGYGAYKNNPLDALYEHITWLFLTLECVEFLRLVIHNKKDNWKTTDHPHPRERRRYALGALLSNDPGMMERVAAIDSASHEWLEALVAQCKAGFLTFPTVGWFPERYPEFYNADQYNAWMKKAGRVA